MPTEPTATPPRIAKPIRSTDAEIRWKIELTPTIGVADAALVGAVLAWTHQFGSFDEMFEALDSDPRPFSGNPETDAAIARMPRSSFAAWAALENLKRVINKFDVMQPRLRAFVSRAASYDELCRLGVCLRDALSRAGDALA